MKITPLMIASMVGGEVEGDKDLEITGFAKIEEAVAGQISFISNPKYVHYLSTTKASVLLVGKDIPSSPDGGTTLIRVTDPYVAIAKLLQAYQSMQPRPTGIEQPCYVSEGVEIPEGSYIGAFAYIGKNVHLGKNVAIYPQAYVGDNVTIGDDTVIRQGAKIYEGCSIGHRCVIHAGAVIGADGFGFAPKPDGSYEKIPQIGNVIIEDDVEIGANTTIDRATFGSTKIGQGTKLDNLIQVAHNVTMGKNNVSAAQAGFAGSTHIGDNNMFGGQVGIAGHLKIGSGVEIGAQSGVHTDVADKARLLGYPALPAIQFAKMQVYLSRLPEIFKHNKSN